MKNWYRSLGILGGFLFLCFLGASIMAGKFLADAYTCKNDYVATNSVSAQNLDDWCNDLKAWSLRIAEDNIKAGANIPWSALKTTGDACSRTTGVGCVDDVDIFGVGISKFTGMRCTAQATPDTTVLVGSGNYYKSNGLATLTYAGGTSPAFPDGLSGGQERLDVLVIDDAGVLTIEAGAASTPPGIAPNYPEGKTPLCDVLIRPGFTQIKDADDAVQGYIKTDARPLLAIIPPIINAHEAEIRDHFFTLVGWSTGLNGGGSTHIGIPAGDTGHITNQTAFESAGAGCSGAWKTNNLDLAREKDWIFEIRWKKTIGTFTNQEPWLGIVDEDTGKCEGAATPINGVLFLRHAATANMKLCARIVGVDTCTTDFAVTETNWNDFKIVMTGGNNAEGFLNGTSIGTVTTGFPTVELAVGVGLRVAGGTSNTNSQDRVLFRFTGGDVTDFP